MADNYVYSGKTVDYRNPGTEVIASGSLLLMGETVGVPLTDIAPGKLGAVAIDEVYRLKKKAADSFAIGDAAYLNTEDKEIVKAKTGNTYAGKVVADAAANTATVAVKLNA